jgi:hypothetical protein
MLLLLFVYERKRIGSNIFQIHLLQISVRWIALLVPGIQIGEVHCRDWLSERHYLECQNIKDKSNVAPLVSASNGDLRMISLQLLLPSMNSHQDVQHFEISEP